MDRFAGRVAVVTGASSGIGAQVTRDLVRAGMIVVGVARRKERLADLAASLQGAPGKLHPLQADLSVADEVRRVFQWVEDNLGGVSVVVNNAGIFTPVPVQDADSVMVQNVITTNLTSVVLGCKEAINSMKKHDIRDGHIFNINSVAGHFIFKPPLPEMSTAVYGASKFGVTALSQGLRYDIQKLPGFKIRVTSISPGAVGTEILPKEYVDNLPDPDCILRPQDISSAIVYALSCPSGVEITELTIRPVAEAV